MILPAFSQPRVVKGKTTELKIMAEPGGAAKGVYLRGQKSINLENEAVYEVQAVFTQAISLDSPGDSLRYLNIPARPAYAMPGSDFVSYVTGMSIEDRERAIVREILSGNVPSFSRKLRPINISQTIDGEGFELICFVACDYMAIGSDQDYLYIPLTPSTAQYLADTFDCSLPTRKIVDDIYSNSEVKLFPQPIPPSDSMTTIPIFQQHTDSINQQRSLLELDRAANSIVAGHKKDIIISNKIYDPERSSGNVVIYGWHLSKDNPIQPVYNGHIAMYADYSHGVRLISKAAYINGDPVYLDDALKDPILSILLSCEGVIKKPYYPESIYLVQDGGL